MIEAIQRETYEYFLNERNPTNGLVADKSNTKPIASIAATGFGITCALVGIERKYHTREAAIEKILVVLRFLVGSFQSDSPQASGNHGFFYRYLNWVTGVRAENSEVSTIDTALLMAGILSASAYFNGESTKEKEIRDLAKKLYEQVDWKWACNQKVTLTHGWTPEHGFLDARWDQGYSEAMILYFLALGSPTHSIDPAGYAEWISTFEWKTAFQISYIYAGPLFIHQYSHVWVDFRGLHDTQNAKYGIDYFENSKRATQVHQRYCIENPMHFEGYGKACFGITASDGPGDCVKTIEGKEQIFYKYVARGAPFGPDDGTLSPWVAGTSLPFAPEIVMPVIEHCRTCTRLSHEGAYGFESSYNPTFCCGETPQKYWVSEHNFGINQGPLVIMIENHLSGKIWELMKTCEPLMLGIRRAGFVRV